jgi:hypothetical protein
MFSSAALFDGQVADQASCEAEVQTWQAYYLITYIYKSY